MVFKATKRLTRKSTTTNRDELCQSQIKKIVHRMFRKSILRVEEDLRHSLQVKNTLIYDLVNENGESDKNLLKQTTSNKSTKVDLLATQNTNTTSDNSVSKIKYLDKAIEDLKYEARIKEERIKIVLRENESLKKAVTAAEELKGICEKKVDELENVVSEVQLKLEKSEAIILNHQKQEKDLKVVHKRIVKLVKKSKRLKKKLKLKEFQIYQKEQDDKLKKKIMDSEEFCQISQLKMDIEHRDSMLKSKDFKISSLETELSNLKVKFLAAESSKDEILRELKERELQKDLEINEMKSEVLKIDATSKSKQLKIYDLEIELSSEKEKLIAAQTLTEDNLRLRNELELQKDSEINQLKVADTRNNELLKSMELKIHTLESELNLHKEKVLASESASTKKLNLGKELVHQKDLEICDLKSKLTSVDECLKMEQMKITTLESELDAEKSQRTEMELKQDTEVNEWKLKLKKSDGFVKSLMEQAHLNVGEVTALKEKVDDLNANNLTLETLNMLQKEEISLKENEIGDLKNILAIEEDKVKDFELLKRETSQLQAECRKSADELIEKEKCIADLQDKIDKKHQVVKVDSADERVSYLKLKCEDLQNENLKLKKMVQALKSASKI